MAEKIDSPSKLLLNIKKQEFATSEKLFRIKLSKQNSPASDPSLKCRAKYDPDTDQAIVFLNCKGTHSTKRSKVWTPNPTQYGALTKNMTKT